MPASRRPAISCSATGVGVLIIYLLLYIKLIHQAKTALHGCAVPNCSSVCARRQGSASGTLEDGALSYIVLGSDHTTDRNITHWDLEHASTRVCWESA